MSCQCIWRWWIKDALHSASKVSGNYLEFFSPGEIGSVAGVVSLVEGEEYLGDGVDELGYILSFEKEIAEFENR